MCGRTSWRTPTPSAEVIASPQDAPTINSIALLAMTFGCAAGLDVAGADWNAYRLSIPGSAATALYDRVKAIFPKTIVFFPLALDKPQFSTFADDSLAGLVMFSGCVILYGPRLHLRAGTHGRPSARRRLCHYTRGNHH
jgi:hypothetical protein